MRLLPILEEIDQQMTNPLVALALNVRMAGYRTMARCSFRLPSHIAKDGWTDSKLKTAPCTVHSTTLMMSHRIEMPGWTCLWILLSLSCIRIVRSSSSAPYSTVSMVQTSQCCPGLVELELWCQSHPSLQFGFGWEILLSPTPWWHNLPCEHASIHSLQQTINWIIWISLAADPALWSQPSSGGTLPHSLWEFMLCSNQVSQDFSDTKLGAPLQWGSKRWGSKDKVFIISSLKHACSGPHAGIPTGHYRIKRAEDPLSSKASPNLLGVSCCLGSHIGRYWYRNLH